MAAVAVPSRPLPGPLFRDRHDAGRRLAERLHGYADERTIVLGLPRGGVVVAYEVARALGLELDVIVPRKVGAPGNEEFGIGAVARGGITVRDEVALRALRISQAQFEQRAQAARLEVERRESRYRRGRPTLDLRGRRALIVDDGIATGGTALASARAARALGAAEVVLAVPVAARESAIALRKEVDQLVILATPPDFRAVGLWYGDFGQTTDTEVEALLANVPRRTQGATGAGNGALPVKIAAAGAVLDGDLSVPAGARGLVLFVHGSGSTRKSPRNKAVAKALNRQGWATLLFDLLAVEEEVADAQSHQLRFDIELLADRLAGALAWVRAQPQISALPVGLFGASTGAAAALTHASREPGDVRAVVSRGGRPDLAASPLEAVRAPTLLIVGAADREVMALNYSALKHLGGPRNVHIVPRATHLFEEPGALQEVARVAGEWFARYLETPPDVAPAA